MQDISERISSLSPERRKLFEKMLKEKGLELPRADKVSNARDINLTPYPNSPLLGISTEGSKPPFFLVHPSEGNVLCYLDLVRHINTDHPFYGFQAPGLTGECEPFTSIEELATHYIEAIKPVCADEPFLLGGWSMGGIVAFEMAQQLQTQGHKVPALVVFDSTSTAHCEKFFREEVETFLNSIPEINIPVDEIDFSSDSHTDYMSDENITYALELAKKSGFIKDDVGLQQVQRYFKIFKNNNLAQLSYEQKNYQGKIIYFKARDLINGHDPTIGWDGLALGGLEIYDVPGNHFSIIREPNVRELARKLGDCLEAT